MLSYVKFEKNETIDLFLIISVIALMFAITTIRFNTNKDLITVFIMYFIFLTILLFSRHLFMKIMAYRHGFQFFLHQTHLSKYGPRKFDSIDAFSRDFLSYKFKGIPTTILSLAIYILTLGYIIFPSLWRYKTKNIPHITAGTMQKYEYGMPIMIRRGVTDYRFMKVIYWGYLYYLIFAIVMKFVLPYELFFSFYTFILFWIAFATLIPIVGTEGYDFFIRSRLAYVSTITILIIGLLSLIVFNSIYTIIPAVTIIASIIIFIIFYKYFL